MVELGFWETLVIVISPIIVGAVSTHFLSRSWQEYQHKITLKRELIDLFNQSIVVLDDTQISFVSEIVKTFATKSTVEGSAINLVEAEINFPENPKEKLEDVFYPKYIELSQLIKDTDGKRSKLTMLINLYTDNKEILQQITQLTAIIFKHRIEISNLIKSKSIDEFLISLEKINNISDEIKPIAQQTMSSFTELKIKKIPV